MSRRWRYPRSHRGSFFGIIPTAAPVIPPGYTPVFQEPSGRNSRLASARSRRARFSSIPGQVLPPPTAIRRRRQWLAAPRRGEFFTIPLVGASPVLPSWVPPILDARRSPARPVRRGEFYVVPLTGAAPPPPLVLPQVLRARVRAMFVRRGHYWVPPLPQQATPVSSWVPQIARVRRAQIGLPRRGEFLPLTARASCPSRITSRRASLPASRRGQTWRPPWIFVPPAGPGPYIPKIITSPHRPPVRPTRRGIYIEPAWPSEAHSCTTPRPNSGTTSRPVGTVTVRPTAGITERPCAAT